MSIRRPQGEGSPDVSILLPVLDEVGTIDACLRSLTSQDHEGPVEIVVADGGSTDGTLEALEKWVERGVTVIHNPDRRQGPGLNRAAAASQGGILLRADAHTIYPPDYVASSVRALAETGATAVGGSLRPEGVSLFGKAVAAAMQSPLTTGPAKFHRPESSGAVDTVYLGAFAREDFERLGGFRSFPSGAGEDADFYFRMRRAGGRVVLVPSIRSIYRPRERPGSLLRQHFRYGQAKAEMLWANGILPSWRPIPPIGLVAGLVTGAVLAVSGTWWPLVVLAGLWAGVLTLAALPTGHLAPGVAFAAALMHLGYGFGFWWGLVRGRGWIRRARRP
ncbi:MAG TPA: glycosyltransferase family 2 protein [Acidimicrobiia bacterium]|nr:glycosyltransferase family 2 protein [Acidimicrobiia bacterium]